MTVEVARTTRRRTTAGGRSDAEPMIAPAATLAIGEIDQTVFDCPSCARPLALGARRCPGCRTRLVNGVTLGKASIFVATGLAVGLLVGGGGGVLLALTRAPAANPAPIAADGGAGVGAPGGIGATASSDPAATSPTTSASNSPTATPSTGVPAIASSAFASVVATNGRLVLVRDDLRAALSARLFDASAVAQDLRTVSADSVYGEQLAGRVAMWSGSSALGADLAAFYRGLHDIAAEGLVASVRNVAVYRSAATNMLRLLDTMTGLDAALRTMASAAGVALPTPPAATSAP